MKHLYLLRHAKAETYASDGGDHERRLSDKGRIRLSLIRDYLTDQKIRPQIVLTSTSARTVETVDHLKSNLFPKAPIKKLRDLYLADAADILKQAQALSDDYDTALLVGHNPGFHELAYDLTRRKEKAGLEKLSAKFPTAALAGFRFEVDTWSELALGNGHLDHLVFPSDFRG